MDKIGDVWRQLLLRHIQYKTDKTGDAWRQLLLRHNQYNCVFQIVRTCRGSAYDHQSERFAVFVATTTSDALPSSTEPYLYLQLHEKKKRLSGSILQ